MNRGNSMTKFEELILNKLLDKYENSVLSKKGSEKELKIKIITTDPIMKSYHTRDSFRYRETNDNDIKRLEKEDLINAYFESNGDFSYLILNLDNVDKVYEILNRVNPKNETKAIEEFLKTYSPTSFLLNFKNKILEEIDKKGIFPKSYFSSYSELKTLILILEEILSLKEETMKRDFSVRVLNDSKNLKNMNKELLVLLKILMKKWKILIEKIY